MVLHQKEAKNKNQNLIAFRIPAELSVTLRKMGINPKEVCIKALQQIAIQNGLMSRSSETGLKTGLKLKKEWTGGDLNPRPPECKSGVHSRLNYRPFHIFWLFWLNINFAVTSYFLSGKFRSEIFCIEEKSSFWISLKS